jgi:sulfur carrier protein
MKIILNGEPHETEAATIEALLIELDLSDAVVATALNSDFVAKPKRTEAGLSEGDRVEILAPMQGG